jgi:UDP-N-acetylglucosamine--N-acetylmuramyl-(pentapeptide) pyrophosphoryl-undecaprenol N-acetylglucosamine transferase
VLQELGVATNQADLLWVGGEGGMEADLVARAGLQLTAIPAAGLHGVGWLQLPGNLWQLLRGYLAARKLLAEFKPDALFFTGGFVAAPVALAGSRIPTLAFIPDVVPGFTLRFIQRFADAVAVVAEETKRYLRRPERAQVTGYPVRSETGNWQRAAAQQHFNLDANTPVLLVFGGSKGALNINRAILAALPELLAEMQIIHVSGQGNWAEVEAAAAALPAELKARYRAFPYLHGDMGAAFAAADLAVCRAGASTLGELPHFKLPAVLVPIPFKQHLQHSNAAYLEQHGAAVVLQDGEMAAKLAATVRGLLGDRGRMDAIRAAMVALAAPDAAARIAGMLRELAAGKVAA